jgi:hypothetical protein
MGRSEGRISRSESLVDLLAWLDAAPVGTLLDAHRFSETITALAVANAQSDAQQAPEHAGGTWRDRLWVVPPETRLTVVDVAEAFGRPKSWVYRHTSEKCAGADRLPHRKLDGELLFLAGELRTWLNDHEETIAPGRIERVTLALAPKSTR